MATALDPTLKDKQFQNWLKGAFTILYGTEALKEFVENEIIDFHKYVMQVVSQQTGLSPATCNTCTTANMLSCPTEGFCKKRKRCNAHDHTIKAPNKLCPNGICHVIKHEVCHNHRFANPSWKNTDAQKWCSDAFQLAKCYMPDGYFDKTTSEDIDFNGLISVVINSKRFQGKLSAKLDVEPNVCSRTRDIGRQFRHSPDFLLSDVDLAKCIDAFLDLLQDSAYLLHNVKVQETVQKIKELKKITVVIQTGNITRDTLMTQNDAVQEIQELFRKYQLEVNSCMNAIQTICVEELEECQSLRKVFQQIIQHTKITEDILKCLRPLVPENCLQTANEEEQQLKMGCRIYKKVSEIAGERYISCTLGGFIDHPQHGLCGLTCAHGLLDDFQMIRLRDKHELSWLDFLNEESSAVYLKERDRENNMDNYIKIGRIVQAILMEGDYESPGMEVAIFLIEKFVPSKGVFVDVTTQASRAFSSPTK